MRAAEICRSDIEIYVDEAGTFVPPDTPPKPGQLPFALSASVTIAVDANRARFFHGVGRLCERFGVKGKRKGHDSSTLFLGKLLDWMIDCGVRPYAGLVDWRCPGLAETARHKQATFDAAYRRDYRGRAKRILKLDHSTWEHLTTNAALIPLVPVMFTGINIRTAGIYIDRRELPEVLLDGLKQHLALYLRGLANPTLHCFAGPDRRIGRLLATDPHITLEHANGGHRIGRFCADHLAALIFRSAGRHEIDAIRVLDRAQQRLNYPLVGDIGPAVARPYTKPPPWFIKSLNEDQTEVVEKAEDD